MNRIPTDLFHTELPAPVKLRYYQKESIQASLDAREKGVMRQLVSQATGSGKSIEIAYLIPALPEPRPGASRSLVLAHREELLEQVKEKIEAANPDLLVGIEQAARKVTADTDVVVASVPTLGRAGSDRIKKFDPADFKLIVIDECVTGDTVVETEIGLLPISELQGSLATQVMSWDGEQRVFRTIKRFMDQGKRQTWEIQLESGQTLRATDNHPIWTREGWKEVKHLVVGDQMLCSASVGVEDGQSNRIVGETSASISQVTDISRDLGGTQTPNGGRSFKSMSLLRQSACAAVGAMSGRLRQPWRCSYGQGELKGTQSTFMVTTKGLITGIWSLLQKSAKPSLAHCLEILRLGFLTGEAQTLGFSGTIQVSRKNGLGAKHQYSKGLTFDKGSSSTTGTERSLSGTGPAVFPACGKSMPSVIPGGRSVLQGCGSNRLVQSESPGGSVMMGLHVEGDPSGCTLKVGPGRRWRRFVHGSEIIMDPQALSVLPRANTDWSTSPRKLESTCFQLPLSTSHPVCNTRFQSISSIRKAQIEHVYDIEVEDTHCFFANGILVHNCHHAAAQSYINILEYFGALEDDSHIVVCGFTATPKRSDGVGLEKVFQEIIYHKGLLEMIEERFLSPLRAMRIGTTTDISQVKTRDGDFAEDQLADAINTPERNETIVLAYQEHAEPEGRSTLGFCADMEHIFDLRDAFRMNGIDARGVTYKTPKDERRQTVEDFRAGNFPVLLNYSLFSEGTDIPNIGCLLMSRPTQSSTVYSQQIGRGTRLHPGKTDCLVMDFVDVCQRKNLMTVPSLLGLSPDFDMEGEDAVKVFREMEELSERNPHAVEHAKSKRDAQNLVAEEFDPFAMEAPSEEVQSATKLRWYLVGKGIYRIDLKGRDANGWKNEGHIEVKQDLLGHWEVVHHQGKKSEEVRKRNELNIALQAAEAYVQGNYSSAMALMHKQATWMAKPATAPQVRFMETIRVPGDILKQAKTGGLTSGQASDAIEKQLAVNKAGGPRRRRKGRARKLQTNLQEVKVGAL